MVSLRMFCPVCGEWATLRVSESCPPSQLRCPCGASFPLHVEDTPHRDVPLDAVLPDAPCPVEALLDLTD